jgi:hypothetical protein
MGQAPKPVQHPVSSQGYHPNTEQKCKFFATEKEIKGHCFRNWLLVPVTASQLVRTFYQEMSVPNNSLA